MLVDSASRVPDVGDNDMGEDALAACARAANARTRHRQRARGAGLRRSRLPVSVPAWNLKTQSVLNPSLRPGRGRRGSLDRDGTYAILEYRRASQTGGK